MQLETVIRLILIVAVSMPQGWCCLIRIGDSCCSLSNAISPENKNSTEDKSTSCPCCDRLHTEACSTDDGPLNGPEFPRSCECRCRCELGIPSSRPNVVVGELDTGWVDSLVIRSVCRSVPTEVSICYRTMVPLQILQCSWQC